MESGPKNAVVAFAARLYVQFLLAEDTQVSFAAKQALVRSLRPRVKRRRVVVPPSQPSSSPTKTDQQGPSDAVARAFREAQEELEEVLAAEAEVAAMAQHFQAQG